MPGTAAIRSPPRPSQDAAASRPSSCSASILEAWKLVVLNRWRKLCRSCFDQLAEQAGVRYSFRNLEAMSWSEMPAPRSRSNRKR
jgi:hypothetical protein